MKLRLGSTMDRVQPVTLAMHEERGVRRDARAQALEVLQRVAALELALQDARQRASDMEDVNRVLSRETMVLRRECTTCVCSCHAVAAEERALPAEQRSLVCSMHRCGFDGREVPSVAASHDVAAAATRHVASLAHQLVDAKKRIDALERREAELVALVDEFRERRGAQSAQ